MVLVPFPGFLYLYGSVTLDEASINVLVPFPGFLYLYCSPNMGTLASIRVLVPFPGFLYLYIAKNLIKKFKISSRPLPGVLISLRKVAIMLEIRTKFSSPSRGSYISTIRKQEVRKLLVFSSPSRGSYISTIRQ